MTIGVADVKRYILPRWRSITQSGNQGDYISLQSSKEQNQNSYDSEYLFIKKRWENLRSEDAAIEMVNAAVGYAREQEAYEAAILLENSPIMSGLMKSTISRIVGKNHVKPTTLTESVNRIATIRRSLRRYHFNPMLWSELALEYAKYGRDKKMTLLAMHAAVALGGGSRYILRSASRMYHHLKETDRALWLLRKSPLIRRDPWIMAAEVAFSSLANEKSLSIQDGRRLVASGGLAPIHLSELACAIATVDCEHGSRKSARSLCEVATKGMNENSCAQLYSLASEYSLQIHSIDDPSSLPRSCHEALAMVAAREGQFRSACEQAIDWFDDEPFSHRPIIFGTYMAAVGLDDPELVINIGTRGLQSNKHHFLLTNNIMVGHLYANQVSEALKYLKVLLQIPISETQKPTRTATLGLLAYRCGEVIRGRCLYEMAISDLSRYNDAKARALAILFKLREEVRVVSNPELRQHALDKKAILKQLATVSFSTTKHPEIAALRKRVQLEFERL